jgi:predicted ArsR family transcriptional regulator
MVEGKTVPTDGARARLEAAAGVLNELGGLAELEEQDGTLVIRGYGCPLAAVTPDHPEVCRLAEALVAEVAGVSVQEHCERGERPRCCFEVASAGDTAQK